MKKLFLILLSCTLIFTGCSTQPNTTPTDDEPIGVKKDLSGSGETYVFSNFILHMSLETNSDGEVIAFDYDQAYPAFSWARVAVTEEEKENVPDDVLVGGISLTSPTQEVMAFSKYICIDGKIFEGTLRSEDDPILQSNSEQTVKYSSLDGEIEDLTQWMSASEENMKQYFEAAKERKMYICLEDGSENPRATGTECYVKEGLPHAGEVAFLRSETDQTAEKPYFDWEMNDEAIRESILGTSMGTNVADLVRTQGADGKSYWQTVDGITGATLVTYSLFYGTAKGIYDSIVNSK